MATDNPPAILLHHRLFCCRRRRCRVQNLPHQPRLDFATDRSGRISLPSAVHYDHITSEQLLRDFCESIASAPVVAYDTEFVSEDSYLPELCLIQLAADGRLAIVDPLEVQDLSPLW